VHRAKSGCGGLAVTATSDSRSTNADRVNTLDEAHPLPTQWIKGEPSSAAHRRAFILDLAMDIPLDIRIETLNQMRRTIMMNA
jgi:hypothetical protein